MSIRLWSPHCKKPAIRRILLMPEKTKSGSYISRHTLKTSSLGQRLLKARLTIHPRFPTGCDKALTALAILCLKPSPALAAAAFNQSNYSHRNQPPDFLPSHDVQPA